MTFPQPSPGAERFNPPPHWPVPAGWEPPRGWSPDPSWPPAPPGWRFWVPAPTPLSRASARIRRIFKRPRARWALAGAVVLTVGLIVLSQRSNPETIVLSPVDAEGNVQDGWTVGSAGSSAVDCSFGSASPYDVSGAVRWCGANAEMGDACWKADSSHVLCLHDPFSDKLSRHSATGLNKPREELTGEVRPMALVLDDGNRCRARIGGAWSSPTEHPDWVGYYSCTNGAVWAPVVKDGKNDPIKKDFWGWSVMVGPYDGHISSHKVTEAYFVGVAGQ